MIPSTMCRHRRNACVIVTLITTTIFIYICQRTPLPVYILDKLNLRPFFLPNIACHACNNFSVPYLIANRDACRTNDTGGDIYLLVLVLSYHVHVASRNVARTTWASVRTYRGMHVRTVFVFGVHEDANFNRQLHMEQKLHGDIVQVLMKEAYRSLTNKSIAAFHWATEHCSGARYILKTDDDSFNMLQRYIDFLLRFTQPLFVGGYCFTVMPDRRPSSKYYTAISSYPDLYYPTYCAGPAYVMSMSAARGVVDVASHVRYLPMEDVFITGACRAALGVQYTQIEGTVIGQQAMTPCALATWAKNAHNVVPEDSQRLWAVATKAKPETDCVSQNTLIFLCLIGFMAAWSRVLYNLCHHRNRTSMNSHHV